MFANTAEAQAVVDRMQAYGVQATGEVVTEEYHRGVSYNDEMTLAEVAKAGGKITRLRVLREGRYCDISYCHATLPGGKIVPVRVTGGVGESFYGLKGSLIEWAKEEGVYAKGLGLLDESNWAVLS